MRKFIELLGCDANTVIEYDLTEVELELLAKIATKSREISEYSCMPIMKIHDTNPDIDDFSVKG